MQDANANWLHVTAVFSGFGGYVFEGAEPRSIVADLEALDQKSQIEIDVYGYESKIDQCFTPHKNLVLPECENAIKKKRCFINVLGPTEASQQFAKLIWLALENAVGEFGLLFENMVGEYCSSGWQFENAVGEFGLFIWLFENMVGEFGGCSQGLVHHGLRGLQPFFRMRSCSSWTVLFQDAFEQWHEQMESIELRESFSERQRRWRMMVEGGSTDDPENRKQGRQI